MLNTSKFHRSFPVEKSMKNLGPSINKHVNLSKVIKEIAKDIRCPRRYLYKGCMFIYFYFVVN